MVFLRWKWIYAGFVYHLFIYVWPLEIQLLKGKRWEPINQFNPATCLCLSQTRTWIPNVIGHDFMCVHWGMVRGDCAFCWHWWNCWPSLFKLPSHNIILFACTSNSTRKVWYHIFFKLRMKRRIIWSYFINTSESIFF